MNVLASVIREYARTHTEDQTAAMIGRLLDKRMPKDDHGHFYKEAGAPCPHGKKNTENPLNPATGNSKISGKIQLRLQQFAKRPRVKRTFSTKELAAVSHAIRTDLTPKQKERGLFEKAFGGYIYVVDLKEDGDFDILSKIPIDETAQYYDKEFSRWKDGTRSKTVRKTHKKTR